MKTVIHVNQHNIKHNAKCCDAAGKKPVLTVKDYKTNRLGNTATILLDGVEVAKVVYRPDNPLSCGARVWIETECEVMVDCGAEQKPAEVGKINSVNLDDPNELEKFWSMYGDWLGRPLAKKLGFAGKGAVRRAQNLTWYARVKRAAVASRTRGDIESAIAQEGVCDRVYRYIVKDGDGW